MKLIVKFLIGFLNLIFSVMKLFPVQNKVIFISRQSDEKSEDMMLLQKEFESIAPEIKLVFLCKKLENDLGSRICYGLHIFRQMYHIATSKVVILDSYCISVSVLKQRESLKVIQMWHALGALKKFGLSIVGEGEGRSSHLAEVLSMHKNYSYVLTSGEVCAEYFGEAFGYDADHIRVMSLPRVDKLTSAEFREQTLRRIYEEYPEFKGKKVVVYAPTFRMERDISEEIDQLAENFDEKNCIFVLKRHPLMEEHCKSALVDKKFTTLEMLLAADYVVCDYSATVFEAAILRKPLFFYTFDYEEYGVNRDFYIDYMNEMPGFISPNADEVAMAIKEDRYDIQKVESFSRRYVKNQENCARKIAQWVADLCGEE